MKTPYQIFFLALLPLSALAETKQTPLVYSLDRCYQLALARSESLAIQQEDIRFAQAKYRESVGMIFPKINFIATERIQNNRFAGSSSSGSSSSGTGGSDLGGFGGSSVGGSGGSGGTDSGVSSGTSSSGGNRQTDQRQRDQFQSFFKLSQPLFTGFREFNTATANKADIQARTLDYRRASELLLLDVADVFYQVLLYQRDLELITEVIDTLEKIGTELNRRVELGRSRRGEYFEAQTQLASQKVILEQVRGLLGASKELLAFLTGIPATQLHVVEIRAFPAPDQLESYLGATGERADILAAIQNERSARKLVSAAKGALWPTINLEANYYPYQNPESEREWSVLFTFDLPIFDGGVNIAKVRQQQATANQRALTVDRLRRTADYDARLAYNNFNASVAETIRLREAEAVTSENYQIQSEDYKLGVVSNLDTLTALQTLYNNRRSLLAAEIDTRIQLIRLNVAAGKKIF